MGIVSDCYVLRFFWIEEENRRGEREGENGEVRSMMEVLDWRVQSNWTTIRGDLGTIVSVHNCVDGNVSGHKKAGSVFDADAAAGVPVLLVPGSQAQPCEITRKNRFCSASSFVFFLLLLTLILEGENKTSRVVSLECFS